MKKNHSLFFGIIISISLIMLSTILIYFMYIDSNSNKIPLTYGRHSEKNIDISTKNLERNVTLAAIGDILIHDRVYNAAKTNNGYNFKPMLAPIKSVLQRPEILLANQETILGGVKIGLSSYPLFNSPQEVGDALIDAGIDIVSTANNHSLDKGEKGQLESIKYMDKINLPHVGTYENKEEQQKIKIITKNDLKIAYLSYTYGTNGIPVPKGKEHLVNIINKKQMKNEIERAKTQADVIVLSLHWGNEYQRYPTKEQKKLAQYLCNQGVNIIFGHHPHVLQPIEWMPTKKGNKSLVVYSLGNFLSGQVWDYKDLGGMVSVDVKKEIIGEKTQISLSNVSFYPTFVSGSRYQYKVVPLKKAAKYGLSNAEEKHKEIMNHMFGNLK